MALDPTGYKLTTEEGLELSIDQSEGIREIFEPEGGNLVTISQDGIIHSAGPSVTFVRDAQDRITRIIAPDNTTLDYSYDTNGDLSAFTDQLGNRTTFTYLTNPNLPPHYLEEIIDPRGIRVARNEYDDDGRLIAHIDAGGNRIEYSHDITGRTETIRDRRGHTTLYLYNTRGDVLVETNALGEATTRTYDDYGNELSRTDALNNTQSWTYDRYGNQLTETDALGNTTTDTYGPFNQFTTQTDPLGNVVLTNFFQNVTAQGIPIFPGPLTRITDALGNATRFGYDSAGQINKITDTEGNITQTEYNASGYTTATIDAHGTRTDYSIDDLGNRLSETTTRTDENGVIRTQTIRYVYDAKGHVTQTTDALGNITQTEYNAIDKVAVEIDALGRRTEYEYDARGNQNLTRYPDGTTETITYDAENNKLSDTDRAGRTTHHVYDAANRLIETHYPDNTPLDDTDNPYTGSEYDSAGRLITRIDERSNITQYEYDAAGRRTAVIDALGNTTTFEYDARGLRTATNDALGRKTRFIYDAVSRLTETRYPDATPADDSDNPRTTTAYDNLGRKVARADMAGQITRFEYDATGNLTAVIDALNQRTEYIYDEQRNKTLQRDANGQATRWTYDNQGRTLNRILPEGQTETFSYNANGNRIRRTDFNGDTTHYGYDSLNRLIRTDYPDTSSVVNTYTLSGQLDTVTDTQGITDYDYDEQDRLIKHTYPNGQAIDYAYDASGNRVELTTANQSLSYTFDALNRLQTVNDATGITRYSYDPVGNRAGINHANGTTASYSYDELNRLIDLSNQGSLGELISEHHYTLGAAGNRIQLDETLASPSGSMTRRVNYDYDALYRLTQEQTTDITNGDRTTSWSYDATGNRLSQTDDGIITNYSYDANDRLQSETTGTDSKTYTYDANGNTLATSENSILTTYEYDAENRLIDVNNRETTYTYDANNIRQNQTSASGTIHYLVDANRDYAQVIEEQDELLSPLTVYSYGDDLLNQQSFGTTSTFHYDGLGSTRVLTDSTSILTDSYSYTAFGETEFSEGTTPNNYLFTGEQFDPNVGFYYLRARYYDQGIGRFTQIDEWMGRNHDPITLHKYLYANTDPVGNIDPSGHMSLGSLGAAMNGFASLAVRAIPVVGRKTLNLLRKAKIWDVYTYAIIWRPHAYMYLDKKRTPGSGLRYDVGANLGWGGVFKNRFRSVDGIIQASSAKKSELKGVKKRVARFTFVQQLLWHYTVVGTESKSCDIEYSLAGVNCISWTVKATAKAIAISKLKL